MTFAAIAAIVGLAVAVAVVLTAVAIVTWSDRRRARLPAMLPSAVLALVLALAVAAWAWSAPSWLPAGVYAIGVAWGLWLMVGDLRRCRWTRDTYQIAALFVGGSILWPIIAIGREVQRRREVRQ